MHILLPVIALSLVYVAGAHAAPKPPLCAAPDGISRVSTRTATCCVALPCHRPLSRNDAKLTRHSGRA